MKRPWMRIAGGSLLFVLLVLLLSSGKQLLNSVGTFELSPSPTSTLLSIDKSALWEPTATSVPMRCAQKDEWVTYTNLEVGFSIEYPPTANLRESSDDMQSMTIYLGVQPQCYDRQCPSGSTIEFRVFANPRQLPIQAFVQEELLTQEPGKPGTDLAPDIIENGGRYKTVGGVRAIQIDDGAGKHPAIERIAGRFKPVIFVPHGDQVIQIRVRSGRGMVPPFDPPCKGMLEMLDDILSGLQLF